MNPSPNLFLIGPSGAGKTSIGRRLAEHYALPFTDLDGEIEHHTGVDIPTIFDIEGEAGFRQREAALLDTLSDTDGIVLATGAGAILDERNRQRLAERGFVLWLDASIEQQLERLSRDQHRPLLAGVDRRRRFADMADVRTPLYRSIADVRITGRNESVAHAFHRILDTLAAHWQPLAPSSRESHADS
ncbi:MAG TPA: shikimate kinase [Rhodanobacteraceae bacterium]|nr:shikimate kinase [Rhodanobacteraceae bacterium]HET8554980.1 shikimate kinase [Rhodanobacteraceae bacterium]